MIDFQAVARASLARAESIVGSLLPGGKIRGHEYICGDLTGGPGESCKVNLKTGKWKDFATDEGGGDLISLAARVYGISQLEAAKKLNDSPAPKLNGHSVPLDTLQMQQPPNAEFRAALFKHSRHGTPSMFWIYRDAAGEPICAVARYDQDGQKKQIVPWIYSSFRWHPTAPPRPRPLYGLDRLERFKKARVVIVEGEKCADAAERTYWPERPCISWMGGVAGVAYADWEPMRGRRVTLWPDNDEPGRKAMERVRDILVEFGCEVIAIDSREFGKSDGFDLWDAEQSGMSMEEITEYAKAHVIKDPPAAPVEAPKPGPEPQEIAVVASPSVAPAGLSMTDTDIANAKRLAARHGKDLRFTPERGWYVWDGRRWRADDKTVRTQELAKETALSIFDEIRDAPVRDSRMQHAKRSQSKNAVESMIWLARSEPGIPSRLTDFDKDAWVLNVANGTLDLRTGELRPHRREDLISNVVEVTYDPAAECELWDGFLWRITDRNDELYAYLRRFVGYLLVGDVSDQSLHFLYGQGSNGKTVFCEVLMHLLGEYAHAVSPDLIMLRRSGGIPNDVARLRGVRAAFMNETSQGSRFDEAKLKDLTGGDTLSARFLHQEFFDFKPTHRLVIRGNHKPSINGTDEGIWRRLRLVPFTVTIPEAERDGHLRSKLEAELPGILNWALRGCLEWQRDGLKPPAIITDAVRAYREESDTLGRFIAECCEVRKLAQVKSSTLFKRYQEFAEAAGERWVASKDLPHEMQRRGFDHKRMTLGSVYLGIELTVDSASDWSPK